MQKSKKSKKSKRGSSDFLLLVSIIALVFIGIVMVFSASWPEAMVEKDDGYFFLRKQLISAIIGSVAMVFFMNFDYRRLKKLSLPIYILSLISGLLIFSPLGSTRKGARRWINLGFTTFMPSDAIKVGSVIFFAAFLANKKDKVRSFKEGVIPALLYMGLSCGLIYLQKDLGTTITLAATMVGMFFISGMKLGLLFVFGAAGALVLYLSSRGEGNEFRANRWTSFLDPFKDKLNTGWQAVQSLYALGSGGLFGLIGSLIVLLLFIIVIWRGILIALKTEDLFGCYLASGIVALIAIQSLINIAVVTSSIPTTGITLPFISYGGTSLLFYMSAVGILLNISRYAKLDRS